MKGDFVVKDSHYEKELCDITQWDCFDSRYYDAYDGKTFIMSSFALVPYMYLERMDIFFLLLDFYHYNHPFFLLLCVDSIRAAPYQRFPWLSRVSTSIFRLIYSYRTSKRICNVLPP